MRMLAISHALAPMSSHFRSGLLACAIAVGFAFPALGCVTETEPIDPSHYPAGVTIERDEGSGEAHVLPTFIAVSNVLTGDTIALRNGHVVRVAGIRAPGPGEPYHSASRDFAATMIAPYPLIKLVYTVETDYDDEVWVANVLFDNPNADEHTQRGSLSLANTMLAQGMARVSSDIDRLAFKYGPEGSGSDGANKSEPFPTQVNERIRTGLRHWENEARTRRVNLWSSSVSD